MKKQKKAAKDKKVILSLICLALLGVIVAFSFRSRLWGGLKKTPSITPITQTQADPNTTDMSPAKPSDNTQINTQKESPTPNPSPTPSNAQVILTYAAQTGDKIVVRGLVYGAKEGLCTAQFSPRTVGQTTITAEGSVTKQVDGQYSCGIIEVAASQFSASGEYDVQLSLMSGTNTVLSTNKLLLNVMK